MTETPGGEPRASARRRVRRLAAFALVMLVQFGLFEAALRTWGSSEAAPAFQGLFEDDPGAGYRLKPNARVRFTTSEFDATIATNSLGLRDEEEIGPKARDERRILLLGDSLVLSVQVDWRQTFGELLEQRLNARQSRYQYRVINAGVQGYGPVEELLLFRRLARALQPDVVLTTIFVGNDAEEAVTSRPRLDTDRRPAIETLHESTITRLRRLVRRSMVLQIVRLRVVSATDRFSGVLSTPEPPLQSYAARPAARIADGIAITRDCVAEIDALATRLGARTAVVLMPARFQVDDGDYGRLRDAVRQAGGELVRDAASERFDAALRTLPVPTLDVLPALRAARPGPDLFFQETVHLTPRGHEVVAAALDRFLEQTGLAPADAQPARR